MKNFLGEKKINFNEFIPQDVQEDLLKVEEKIRGSLFANPPLIEKIGKHILDSGGKRLRPMLHILSSRLANYRGNYSINIATSAELVHTATLLHDDVIDFSFTRRNKPSANILWGNKSSILVGDYLLSQCVSMIVEVNNTKVTKAFSRVFGDLTVGEILELVNEHNLNITLDSYFEIIEKKTSSLFKLCMEAGTFLNSCKSTLNGSLGGFGINFGITFQLIDDYLDYFGDAEKMGKPVMGDFKEKKVTFPLINLIKLCTKKEHESLKEIFYQLKINKTEELFIIGLMEKYEINKMILNIAREYINKAYQNLKEVEDSQYKKALLAILEYNLYRDG